MVKQIAMYGCCWSALTITVYQEILRVLRKDSEPVMVPDMGAI